MFLHDGVLMIRSMRAAISLISIILAPISLRAGAAAPNPQPTNIVIVGAGISGLCAALEAARAGARVTVIDMGSVFGGHAVMSSGMVCMVGTPEQRASHVVDSPELATRDFLEWGEDADPSWAKFYAEKSPAE